MKDERFLRYHVLALSSVREEPDVLSPENVSVFTRRKLSRKNYNLKLTLKS